MSTIRIFNEKQIINFVLIENSHNEAVCKQCLFDGRKWQIVIKFGERHDWLIGSRQTIASSWSCWYCTWLPTVFRRTVGARLGHPWLGWCRCDRDLEERFSDRMASLVSPQAGMARKGAAISHTRLSLREAVAPQHRAIWLRASGELRTSREYLSAVWRCSRRRLY